MRYSGYANPVPLSSQGSRCQLMADLAVSFNYSGEAETEHSLGACRICRGAKR